LGEALGSYLFKVDSGDELEESVNLFPIGFTYKVKLFVIAPLALEALIVFVKIPCWAGVPEITPVVLLRETPGKNKKKFVGDSATESIEKVGEFVAETASEYEKISLS
jgi:hypothetical protein